MLTTTVDPTDTAAATDSLALRFFGTVASGPVAIAARGLASRPAGAGRLLAVAAESGQTLLDCSQAEQVVGRALTRDPALRDHLALATTSRSAAANRIDARQAAIAAACDRSLRLLGVDVIDLFLVDGYDHYTDPADLAATLTRLRASGKIREAGVIGYTVSQFRTLAEYLPFELVTKEIPYSVHRLDPMFDGTLDLALETGTTPLAADPLAGLGLAPGDGPDASSGRALIERLDALAEREATTRAVVALGFILAHPSRPVVVVDSIDPAHIEAYRNADRITLDHADCYSILHAATDLSHR